MLANVVAVVTAMVASRSVRGRNRTGEDGKCNNSKQHVTDFHGKPLPDASAPWCEQYPIACSLPPMRLRITEMPPLLQAHVPCLIPPLLQVNQHVATLNAHGEYGHAFIVGILRHSRPDIERPGVPRTHHSFAFDPALPKWSAPVWTPVVERR